MVYGTLAGIKTKLHEKDIIDLSNDDETDETVESVIDDLLIDANGEIDAILGSRYPVPLTEVPPIIKTCSEEIAIYLLFQRKADEIPESWDKAYSRRIKYLKEVALGKLNLPITEEGASGIAFGAVISSHFKDD